MRKLLSSLHYIIVSDILYFKNGLGLCQDRVIFSVTVSCHKSYWKVPFF